MYNDVTTKVDEIIELFAKNDSIKEMISLKKELLNDDYIVSKLNEYEKLLVNPYDDRCISIKKDLLNDARFQKYKDYEDQLFILTLKINNVLRSILREKSCLK